MAIVDVTKEEAMRLILERSFEQESTEVTCGHPGCADHRVKGQRMIHTFGTFGSDISLDRASEVLASAEVVRWKSHILHHDLLAVTPNGRTVYFDVPIPSDISCEHCCREVAVCKCCSSHGKLLCHHCYRRTHFVEICADECEDCEAEGLDRVMKAGNAS